MCISTLSAPRRAETGRDTSGKGPAGCSPRSRLAPRVQRCDGNQLPGSCGTLARHTDIQLRQAPRPLVHVEPLFERSRCPPPRHVTLNLMPCPQLRCGQALIIRPHLTCAVNCSSTVLVVLDLVLPRPAARQSQRFQRCESHRQTQNRHYQHRPGSQHQRAGILGVGGREDQSRPLRSTCVEEEIVIIDPRQQSQDGPRDKRPSL